jgi:hypothetical protein
MFNLRASIKSIPLQEGIFFPDGRFAYGIRIMTPLAIDTCKDIRKTPFYPDHCCERRNLVGFGILGRMVFRLYPRNINEGSQDIRTACDDNDLDIGVNLWLVHRCRETRRGTETSFPRCQKSFDANIFLET